MAYTSNDWTHFADNYHSRFEHTARKFAGDAFLLSKHLLPSSNSTKPIAALDLACGSGSFERALSQLNNDRPSIFQSLYMTLLATDYASGMIHILNRYLSTNPSTKPTNITITTQVQDGQILPQVPDNSIDIIYSNFGLFLFPDRKSSFQSVSRVLRQNGYLVFTSWTTSNTPTPSLFDIAGHVLLSLPERLRPTPQPGVPSIKDFASIEEIKNQIEKYSSKFNLSLKFVKSYKSKMTMFFENVHDIWLLMADSSPALANMCKELTEEEKKVILDKLAEVFGIRKGEENEPLMMDAVAYVTVVKKI